MANFNPFAGSRFKPGQSGNPSGRPRKLLDRIDEKCAADGKHPYDELMKLVPELKPNEQAEVWLQLLAYCQAKPKSFEEPEVDKFSEMPTEELIRLVKEKLPELEANAGRAAV